MFCSCKVYDPVFFIKPSVAYLPSTQPVARLKTGALRAMLMPVHIYLITELISLDMLSLTLLDAWFPDCHGFPSLKTKPNQTKTKPKDKEREQQRKEVCFLLSTGHSESFLNWGILSGCLLTKEHHLHRVIEFPEIVNCGKWKNHCDYFLINLSSIIHTDGIFDFI